MAIFIWKGKTRSGKSKSGEMEAKDKDEVIRRLKAQQIQANKVKKKPKEFLLKMPGSSGVDPKDLMIFTRQFSTMIDAGLPLVQCLDILSSQQENPFFKIILKKIKADVETGKTFADALSKHPKLFNSLYVNLVEAGETGGILDTIMNRLATQIEKSVKLAKQVKSAFMYPVAITLVAMGAVAVLLFFVIPVFEKMFNDFNGELPMPTQVVIDFSNWSIAHWYLFIATPVGLIILWNVLNSKDKTRRIVHRVLISLPIFGDLIRKTAVSQFTRTMGTMLSSGVPILDSLEIVAKSSSNMIVSEGIMYARAKVSEGKNLAEPLAQTNIFPSMVCQMVSIGETTGALDNMLNKIADFYEEEVDAAVSGLTSLLEPIIMVFLAVILGSFLIAMYLPIFTIAGSVG